MNTYRALISARILVPIIFGFYSLWLGADANWDLYNYHIYNPFAWMNGKLHVDLAPAGMQSYFNPLLDSLLYLLNTHLPSRVVGFALGVLHGMMFVLLLGIARHTLPALPDEDHHRAPLLIAMAGCLTANFLSEFGNSMGDNTTALLILAGLSIVLSRSASIESWSVAGVLATIGSGALVGMSVGLKLTNAVYAVALCIALLTYSGGFFTRLRLSFVFGVAVLFGIATTGGYWMWHLWREYGNPLYPQFGSIFHNPLTRDTGIADVRWLPHGFLEIAFWPFIFSINSYRVGEAPIHQVIWPIVYVVFWCWLITLGASTLTRKVFPSMSPRQRLVIIFVALGYLLWMKLFSIFRYIVAIEVLTPLVLMLFLYRLLPHPVARYMTISLISVSTLVVAAGGAKTWGHEGWSDPLYHAQLPNLSHPVHTTVIIYGKSKAWSWLATQFPSDIAFTQLESSFPATAAFGEQIRSMVKERGNLTFGIIDGADNWRADRMASMNQLATRIGLTKNVLGCAAMSWAVRRLNLHASVRPADIPSAQCSLGLRADDVIDPTTENRSLAAQAAIVFERNGFILDTSSCRPYEAGIGKGVLVYQWCRVALR